MKRFVTLILVCCITFCMCACGGSGRYTSAEIVKKELQSKLSNIKLQEKEVDKAHAKYTFTNSKFDFFYEEMLCIESSTDAQSILKRTNYTIKLFECFDNEIKQIFNDTSFDYEIHKSTNWNITDEWDIDTMCITIQIEEEKQIDEVILALNNLHDLLNDYYLKEHSDMFAPILAIKIKHSMITDQTVEIPIISKTAEIPIIKNHTECIDLIESFREDFISYQSDPAGFILGNH